MRTLLAVGLIVSVLIVLNEFRFVGRSGLAFVLIGLAFVQAIHGWVLWGLAKPHG